MIIKEMPTQDKPREKLKRYGSKFLSDSELVAIILRVGKKGKNVLELAKDVVNKLDDMNDLNNFSYEELTSINGIGEVKAIELLATVELGYRIHKKSKSNVFKITNPKLVYEYIFDEIYDLKQEHFFVVFLNIKNEIIKHKLLFVGSLNQTVVHPREIFKEAVKSSSASIVLIHNHPSGDTTPSNEDIVFTKRINEIGLLMDIKLLDHIIVSNKEFTSLKTKGLF